ncbi:MAG: hypothetical protein ACD_79C00473G0001 [uncultured bacterium]|nr:MAG: hypothetical protein ACD_79C00473G0001 [uncultured bacterium]
MAIFLPFITQKASSIFLIKYSICSLFTLSTAFNREKSYPKDSDILTKAETSFGKHEPP